MIQLTQAQLLAALYNGSKPQGMGYRQYIPGDWTEKEAQDYLNKLEPPNVSYMDYVQGRIIKVNLACSNYRLYDRDLGDGHAEEAITEFCNKYMR